MIGNNRGPTQIRVGKAGLSEVGGGPTKFNFQERKFRAYRRAKSIVNPHVPIPQHHYRAGPIMFVSTQTLDCVEAHFSHFLRQYREFVEGRACTAGIGKRGSYFYTKAIRAFLSLCSPPFCST